MKVKQIIALVVVVALLMTGSVLVTLAYLTDSHTVTNVFTVGNIQMKLDEAIVNAEGEPLLERGGEVVDDVKEAGRTEEGNSYHLVPGHTYTKDPTVTVLANSDDCYVRIMVEVTDYEQLCAAFPRYDSEGEVIEANAYYYDETTGVFLLERLVNDTWDKSVWNFNSFVKKNTKENKTVIENGEEKTVPVVAGVYEFRYKEVVAKQGTDRELEPLFKEIAIPSGIDNDALQLLNNLKIAVTAHAIQADGFEADADREMSAADVAWEAFTEEMVPAESTTTTETTEGESLPSPNE